MNQPNAANSKRMSKVTVTSTATKLLSADPTRVSAWMRVVTVGKTVYLGKDNTVTTADGLPFVSTDQPLYDEHSSDAWWGIVSAGDASAVVVIIEVLCQPLPA